MSRDETLVILPVFDRVEERLQHQAVRNRGWARVDRHLTLAGLIDLFFRAAITDPDDRSWWHGYRPASPVELALVRRLVIQEARERFPQDLTALLSTSSISRLLANFFDECGEGMVTPEELTRFAAEAASGNDRLALLAHLWSSYRALLSQAKLVDPGDRVRIAQDFLTLEHRPLPHWFEGIRAVEVRDQVWWSALRLSFLIRLAVRLRAELGPPDRLRLVVPYSHEGYRLFHYLEPTLREIEQRIDLPLELAYAPIEEQAHGPPGRIAAALFGDHPAPPGHQDAIRLASAPSRRQELRAMARRIRRLLGDGIKPDDIAIGLRHPQTQWREVVEALDAYHIPCHYRRGETLSETPLLRHLVEILSAVGNGLPREAFERILTSVFCAPPAVEQTRPGSDSPDQADRPGDQGGTDAIDGAPTFAAPAAAVPHQGFVERALSILRLAGIRDLVTGADSSRNGYEVRLATYLKRCRATRRPESGTSGPADGSGGGRMEDQEDQNTADVREILERVRWLLRCQAARSLTSWTDTLLRLAGTPVLAVDRALGPEARMEPIGDRPDRLSSAWIRGLALNRRSWGALETLLKEMAEAGRGFPATLTAGEFRSLLLEVASGVSLHPIGSRGAAVRIVPVRHLAGARFAHVFLPHVNERVFPQPPQADPLLRDPERLAFDRWRCGRPSAGPVFRAFRIEEPQPEGERVPVRRSEEVVLFCLALASASVCAHVSWSTRDAKDRPLLPSLFVEGLARVLDRSVSPHPPSVLDEFEPFEVLPDLSRIQTREELACQALSRASIQLDGVTSPTWLATAERALGGARLSGIVSRIRVELARHLFFRRVLSDPELRDLPPPEVPQEIASHLGYLASQPVLRWLTQKRSRFDATAPVSATRLERYGQCPARFFFQDVLRLSPDEEAEEEMAGLSRGRLLHLALENFYRDLAGAGYNSIAALRTDTRPQVIALVERAVDDATRQLETELHLGHPRLLDLNKRQLVEKIVQALDRVIDPRCRSAQLPLGFPAFQEWRFGIGEVGPVSIELGRELGSICLTGRIDRIDLDDEGRLLITDYKLSSQASQKAKLQDPRLHRRDFQLSVYTVAALAGLRPASVAELAVQYFCLEDGKSARLEGGELLSRLGGAVAEYLGGGPAKRENGGPSSESVSERNSTVLTLPEGLSAVVRGIRRGVFAAATRGCEYCELAVLCRVDERVRQEARA